MHLQVTPQVILLPILLLDHQVTLLLEVRATLLVILLVILLVTLLVILQVYLQLLILPNLLRLPIVICTLRQRLSHLFATLIMKWLQRFRSQMTQLSSLVNMDRTFNSQLFSNMFEIPNGYFSGKSF